MRAATRFGEGDVMKYRLMRTALVGCGLGMVLAVGTMPLGVAGEGGEGTNGPDVFRGTAGADEYDGLGGNDRIYGYRGRDHLSGGDGNDRLYGGKGSDGVFGDAGDDVVLGGPRPDSVYGGRGRDVLRGGAGWDTLVPGNGADVVYAGSWSDEVYVDNDGRRDVVYCGRGYDWVEISLGRHERRERLDRFIGCEAVYVDRDGVPS